MTGYAEQLIKYDSIKILLGPNLSSHGSSRIDDDFLKLHVSEEILKVDNFNMNPPKNYF